MSQKKRQEVLAQTRRQYARAGRQYKSQLVDQLVELLGYHRKAALRGAPQGLPARLVADVRERLLAASRATLDRLLIPARIEHRRRTTTRPGSLLRTQVLVRTE